MTLGAQRVDIVRLILQQGFAAVLAGTLLGVVLGLVMTRLLRSMLFGIEPSDWPTFTAAAILLIGVAFGASWIPARRATRVDPAIALRQQ
jgi:putative ABC transport system permease protein